jgi:hypothetical protein
MYQTIDNFENDDDNQENFKIGGLTHFPKGHVSSAPSTSRTNMSSRPINVQRPSINIPKHPGKINVSKLNKPNINLGQKNNKIPIIPSSSSIKTPNNTKDIKITKPKINLPIDSGTDNKNVSPANIVNKNVPPANIVNKNDYLTNNNKYYNRRYGNNYGNNYWNSYPYRYYNGYSVPYWYYLNYPVYYYPFYYNMYNYLYDQYENNIELVSENSDNKLNKELIDEYIKLKVDKILEEILSETTSEETEGTIEQFTSFNNSDVSSRFYCDMFMIFLSLAILLFIIISENNLN